MVPLQEMLPTSPEAWGFATLLVTTISGGIAWFFKGRAAQAKAAADALSVAQQRLIEAAERREREANERADKREEMANKRMDAALQGMAQLTTIVTELTNTIKVTTEEVRRANATFDAVLRDRR